MTKSSRIPITHFAPPERVPIAIIHRQAAELKEFPLASMFPDSIPNCAFILNEQRQIVYASDDVASMLPTIATKNILGLRPGEAFGCIHASEGNYGCGTTESCRLCGAANAILSGLAGRRDLREYRLTRLVACRRESQDFLVLTVPLVRKRQTFCLLAIADIKHRDTMERLFAQLPSLSA
jgi:hypothetical protein